MPSTPSTAERNRHLPWEGCLNARDLGGYATSDGRTTRWGAVIRSDNLALLTPADRDALIAYGVRTIIDLRFPHETADTPNPFADPGHGLAYHHISLLDSGDVNGSLAREYCRWIDDCRQAVALTVSTVARAAEGGVLIHCMAGKDRTGITSALLLSVVGVPADTIAVDYSLTAECLRPRDEEFLADGPGTREEREALLAFYSPRAEVMLEVLHHLDQRHGGPERYLLQAGVSAEDVALIRERLIE